MFLCCRVKQQLRNTAPRQKPCPKRHPPTAVRRQALCASALNTRGNTTHEVRPTDVLLPLRLHPHIVLIARLRKYVCSSNACSCAQRAVLRLRSKATAPAARRRAPAEAHGTQLEGPNCAVPQKRPRKIKCSYTCLRIRWHGSPCRPAVREVVHQLSVEGLRVRGPRAGFRSCAASAPGAAALPAAHAGVMLA